MFFINVDPLQIVDIVLVFILITVFSIIYLKKIKNKMVVVSFLFLIISLALASIFKLTSTTYVILAIFIVFSMICSFINISAFRSNLISDNLFSKVKKHVVHKDNNMLDADKYKIIDDAVRILSKTKTGALLTFEKTTDLTEYMKNGSIINSPISVELIQTIFYQGTRLHDGAIIIRDDIIVAASVYYTPSTKALTGKYGSRHRAALGISSETDSVTVVVSEETGRISIAYQGKLEPIHQDEFLEEFKNYMEK